MNHLDRANDLRVELREFFCWNPQLRVNAVADLTNGIAGGVL